MSSPYAEALTCLAPTRRRLDLSPAVARGYWLDVHGPVIAALPGLDVYWQFHLEHDHGGNWPTVPGIESAITEDDQLDGLAELGWLNEARQAEYFAAADAANIQADEPVLFRMVMVQMTAPGRTRTLKNDIESLRPNGDDPNFRLFLGLRKREGASRDEFTRVLWEEFAPALAASGETAKVRLSLMQDFDAADWGTEEVDNAVSVDRQYQAYIELAFTDRIAMRRLYNSPEFKASAERLSTVSHHVNAFRVKETCAYVVDGDMTLVGRYGSHRARMITEAGSIHMWLPAVEGQA